MMKFIKQNKLLIFVGVLAVIVIDSVIFFSLFNTGTNNNPNQPIIIFSPPPTPQASSTESGPQPGRPYQVLSPDFEIKQQQDIKVTQLMDKLPFDGQNFSFTYDFDNFAFVLSLNRGNEAEGNREFDQFLRDNQIESRSWLKNLVIKSS